MTERESRNNTYCRNGKVCGTAPGWVHYVEEWLEPIPPDEEVINTLQEAVARGSRIWHIRTTSGVTRQGAICPECHGDMLLEVLRSHGLAF